MSEFADALREFHEHPNALVASGTNSHAIRWTLHEEEHEELMDALVTENPELIARELADLVYICFGTAYAWNIDLDEAFREVARANMQKMEAGIRREDGKIMKPPGFVPPDMSTAVPDDDYRHMKVSEKYGPHWDTGL
jgi:NTP pyrophosphatase (non-canonical NTP hydrolase)